MIAFPTNVERNHHSLSFEVGFVYLPDVYHGFWHWIPPDPAGRPSFPWAAAHSQRHALRSHQTGASGHWSPPCESWQTSHWMEITVSPWALNPPQKEKKQNTSEWEDEPSGSISYHCPYDIWVYDPISHPVRHGSQQRWWILVGNRLRLFHPQLRSVKTPHAVLLKRYARLGDGEKVLSYTSKNIENRAFMIWYDEH